MKDKENLSMLLHHSSTIEPENIVDIVVSVLPIIANAFVMFQSFEFAHDKSEKHELHFNQEMFYEYFAGKVQNLNSDAEKLLKYSKDLHQAKLNLTTHKWKEFSPLIKDDAKTYEHLLQMLEKRIEEIEYDNKTVKKDIENLKNENIQLKEYLFDSIVGENSLEKIQYLPIQIYIDSDNPQDIYKIYDSVLNFVEALGFKKFIEFEHEKGSWFKKLIGRSIKAISDEEVTSRLQEAEYGVEANYILNQQAMIDRNQSEALLNIIKALDNTSNAAIRMGSILVVKVTDENGVVNIQSRTLSIRELHYLNKNPQLLNTPHQILSAIANSIYNDEKRLEKPNDN